MLVIFSRYEFYCLYSVIKTLLLICFNIFIIPGTYIYKTNNYLVLSIYFIYTPEFKFSHAQNIKCVFSKFPHLEGGIP